MNVKPGDLAIVIYSPNGETIGKIVKVLHRKDGHYTGLPSWMIESTSPAHFRSIFGIRRIFPAGTTGRFPDAWLRPVSGLPDEQNTEEHNKQEA